MTVKKMVGKLHLWLGLTSGLLVFIVAITGCILAFEHEIKSVIRPFQYVEPVANGTVLPPSRLKAIAEKQVPGKPAKGVNYGELGHSVNVPFYGVAPDYYYQVYLNPYTGEVLKVVDEESDFFHFILHGHYYLWLPEEIGQAVTSYGTLVFAMLLITGMVLWWPKNLNKTNRNKSFKVKWKAQWRRVNYDLHNVPGFYALSISVVLAVTGMIFGIDWLSNSIYWATTGGKTLPEYRQPLSDSTATPQFADPVDRLWYRFYPTRPETASLFISTPELASESIIVSINHRPGTYYKTDYYNFDQYTLKELKGEGPYFGVYDKAGFGDKLRRMNYDIHVGAILSLPGKILAFCASLICASLPVTGFIIWWGRRKKKTAKPQRRVAIPEQVRV
ncbi:putative iron-regulated membrane protein [Larkinella arboricola]|uniref:Putative iron-regulated membrane protein n=1 Tax=Larkinella arboricola TaxID=643671 RepID=A0A327WSS4_LARAB|nr:PepSY-associated TM helix domain-containing protein [Larkinella arboricola]RAJ94327.1 putative iron-regulated membrane protein [Larkinella arboricola]